tara:strand:+ start:217 stop:429 length:213 start_codon:yes stop_codon:yes gene_type:complete
MDNIKNKLIDECVNVMKREDVKNEIKTIFRPIINMILKDIYPYILISMLFVIISFLLVLGIFILLLRYKK